MTRTSYRYGSAALASAIALGSLVSAASALAAESGSAPAQVAIPVVAPAAGPAVKAAAPVLTRLTVPDLGASATSQGYALRDVLVDLSPDLAERELAFVLQRQDGETWAEAAAGTASGADSAATVANMPAGTYRVVVPAQMGMAEFVGEPFSHQPRLLSAAISYSADDVRTSIDVDPDPTASATYSFTLQSKGDSGWQFVGDFATTDAAGGRTFTDLVSGTYRVVLPDQADAVGAVSNEVSVVSSADQRAAAAAAAAAAVTRSAPSTPTAPSRTAAVDAPASAGGGGIVGTAMAQLGDAYVRGGNGPNAFDCSGLTSYAYRAAGISIPRTAASQYAASTKVSSPRPGDLVFFLNGAQHVGIYIGNGRMVHAATPSRGVEVTSISSGWYARTFTGYGRF